MIRAALSLLTATSLSAATLNFELKSGHIRSVTLDSPVDDSNFRDPPGYAAHGTLSRHFTRRIEIENIGDEPLAGRLLVVNGRDWTNADALIRALNLSAEPERHTASLLRLHTFWKDHHSHAGSGAKLAMEPFAALNFWGFTLCGDDTLAFARLAHAIGIPARHVALNGHIAAEYRCDGVWHVVDGDQAACYLRLDNSTPAGAAELRADPFLVLRTRVFGKYHALTAAAGAFNSSLIEHLAPPEPKPVKIKSAPAPLNVFTLQPGETLVWHCDTPPEKPAGELLTDNHDELRAAALATIEHRFVPKHHTPGGDGTITLRSPFPILRAVNETSGANFTPRPGEIVFKAALPAPKPGDKISLFSQCSRNALPLLGRGDNTAVLDAKDGKARVAYHYDPPPKLAVPSAEIAPRAAEEGTPAFDIAAKTAPERVWWQISDTRDFAFVAPSLEGIVAFAPELRLDPLTDTFISPGRDWFIRVKPVAAGVWGAWSEPARFRVKKPRQPSALAFADAGGGRVRLSWESGAKDAEFLVFASNRRDFMPEIFADEEITAMEHLKVTATRPNKNLLATTSGQHVEFKPAHRFYRVIARRRGVLSVPGALAEIPGAMAAGLPPATILQTRAGKRDGRDVYRAKEETYPAEPAPAEVTEQPAEPER